MLTEKRYLRGGVPLWLDTSGGHVRTRAKLRSEACDVAVVGGGVSGALIALTLARAGLDVVVVDRRQPGLGSTAASTAMIQYEIDTPLRELRDKIGARRAIRAYRRSLKAVADLKALIAAEKIHCDWRDRDAVYLAGNKLGYRALQLEAAARRRVGLPSACRRRISTQTNLNPNMASSAPEQSFRRVLEKLIPRGWRLAR